MVVVQSGVTKRSPVSQINGAFFELNPASLSQLVSGGFTDFKSGGGNTNQRWTSVAFAERGPALLWTPGGGTTVTEIFLFSPTIVWPSERREMTIEMETIESVGAPGYVGPFFLGEGSPPTHGFAHLANGAEWQTLLNNGAVERSGTTAVGGGRYCRYRIRGDKPAGGPPRISSLIEGYSNAGTANAIRRSGSSSTARGGVNEFGSASTLGSSWNGLQLGRFGICIASSGGNPPPSAFHVLSYRVFLG